MHTLLKLGNRLRELRVSHKLTQEEFAELAGIGYKFYQDIEGGRKKQIWLDTVERLAAAYHLEAWQLLAPDLPQETQLQRIPPKSRVHNKRRDGVE